jgi:cell division ATPase FtsA
MFSQRLKETLSRQKQSPGNGDQAPQRTISMVLENGEVYRRVIQLTESIFNEVTDHLQKVYKTLIENALRKIGIEDKDIDQVVLVGGGSQLFTQVRYLRERFGEEKIVLADNPDEIVVQGIGLEYGKSFEDYKPTIVFTTEILEEMMSVEPEIEIEKTPWELISDEIRFTIDGDGIKKVGRDKSNHLQINRERLSRFHAELELIDNELQVVDLNSTNGTFLNDERISPNQKHTLSPGDRLRFGDFEFICTDD